MDWEKVTDKPSCGSGSGGQRETSQENLEGPVRPAAGAGLWSRSLAGAVAPAADCGTWVTRARSKATCNPSMWEDEGKVQSSGTSAFVSFSSLNPSWGSGCRFSSSSGSHPGFSDCRPYRETLLA